MRIIDYVQEGGLIMYLLVLFNIIGLTLLIWKAYSVYDFRKNLVRNGKTILDGFFNSLSRSSVSEEIKMSLLKDEIASHVKGLERGLNTIKIIASISPLMGLLGTVLGILTAFNVIAKNGLSDPSLFAGGISMALITTVGGLIVSIPHFIGHNYLVGALDQIENQLEKDLVPKAFTEVERAS